MTVQFGLFFTCLCFFSPQTSASSVEHMQVHSTASEDHRTGWENKHPRLERLDHTHACTHTCTRTHTLVICSLPPSLPPSLPSSLNHSLPHSLIQSLSHTLTHTCTHTITSPQERFRQHFGSTTRPRSQQAGVVRATKLHRRSSLCHP